MKSQTSSGKTENSSQNSIKKKLRLNYFSLSFQLRYGVWLATIGTFCFCLMGFLIHLSIRHAVQDSMHNEAAKEALSGILSLRSLFFSYDVLIPAMVLIMFLLAIGIVGTHRIAGPLFAIKRHMNRVRMGKEREQLRLRRGDELMDVAASLNALLQTGWSYENEFAASLIEIKKDMEAGRSGAAIAKLTALSVQLEARRTPGSTMAGPEVSSPRLAA